MEMAGQSGVAPCLVGTAPIGTEELEMPGPRPPHPPECPSLWNPARSGGRAGAAAPRDGFGSHRLGLGESVGRFDEGLASVRTSRSGACCVEVRFWTSYLDDRV
jgi:hypothetical protein